MMLRNRTKIIVEVDLDPVPGWGNVADDYVKLIQRNLNESIPHYNPTVRALGEHEFIGGPPKEE